MSIIPRLDSLPGSPRRVILHWTAGGPEPTSDELRRYHYLVSQSGEVFMGVDVKSNMRVIPKDAPMSEYAAHTRALNSWSVGISLCGMKGAKENGDFGPFPINRSQVDALAEFVAECCEAWELTVTRDTVFSHAEAQSLHGISQPGKWDVTVLPWLPRLTKAEAGDMLRLLVRGAPVPV